MGFDEDFLMEYGSEGNYLKENNQYEVEYENYNRTLSRMEEDFDNMLFEDFIEKYIIDKRNDVEDFIYKIYNGLSLSGYERERMDSDR